MSFIVDAEAFCPRRPSVLSNVIDDVALDVAPLPLSATVCGLLLALSARFSVAVRLPVAEGVNVTETVQLAPTARVEGLSGQVLVRAKSPAFAPVTPTLLIASAAVPVLVTVTV